MLNAAPTHINANICVPISAPIFRPACDVITLRKMTNITVPIIAPAAVSRAAMNVHIANGSSHHREYSVTGATKMLRKFMHTPVRKQPNMTREAILIRSRMLLMSAGSAMVAPDRSSLSRMETGLNQ